MAAVQKHIDVTKHRLKQVTSINGAIDNAKTIVSYALNVSKDEITFGQNEYAVPIDYNGFETVIVFGWHEHLNQLRITIANTVNKDEPCLDLRVAEKKGLVVGKLGFVRTRGSDNRPAKCKIPDKQAAAWMVSLADEIYCMLGLQGAFLEDDAQLNCNSENVNFLLLRIFQGKFSWYESFGYPILIRQDSSGTIPEDYHRDEYEKDAQVLRKYPVEKLKKMASISAEGAIDKFGGSSSTQNTRMKILNERRVQLLSAIQEAEESKKFDSIGEMLSWMWVKDCNLYVKVVSFMETTMRLDMDPKGQVYDFAGPLRRVTYIGQEYLKKLKC